jgi:hypothetical protein
MVLAAELQDLKDGAHRSTVVHAAMEMPTISARWIWALPARGLMGNE